MKKENRQLARQRRARERQRMERNAKIRKIIRIGIPILVVVLFIGVLVWDHARTTSASEDAAAEADSSQESTEETADSSADGSVDSTETAAAYSTDTSMTVAYGDTVNIDYVGTIDGVEFDGGNTNGAGTDLEIGSGMYIDDFEAQLEGSHPGDTVEVYVTFPDDYGNEELNGKDAVFTVTINGIYEE